jgi:hypothetical protein
LVVKQQLTTWEPWQSLRHGHDVFLQFAYICTILHYHNMFINRVSYCFMLGWPIPIISHNDP